MSTMILETKPAFDSDNWSDISKRILGFSSTFEEQQGLIGIQDNIGPNRKARIDRDRLNHRVIEKKRRDRMNNCLADLSRLIPSVYTREGQGRIEKTEVIEMAIKHIIHLQQKNDALLQDSNVATVTCSPVIGVNSFNTKTTEVRDVKPEPRELYSLGFKNCQDLVVSFLCNEEAVQHQRREGLVREDVFARLVHCMQIKSQTMFQTTEAEMIMEHKTPVSRLRTQSYVDHHPSFFSAAGEPGTHRQRYASTCCGSESGYSSDALAQSTGVSKMSPWTSGGTMNSGAVAGVEGSGVEGGEDGSRNDTPSPGYKFKSDIHLRFKAATAVAEEKQLLLVDPSSSQSSSPPSINNNNNSDVIAFKRNRAGFILNRSGSYYLPVQVGEEALSRIIIPEETAPGYCLDVDQQQQQQQQLLSACHPISISVKLTE